MSCEEKRATAHCAWCTEDPKRAEVVALLRQGVAHRYIGPRVRKRASYVCEVAREAYARGCATRLDEMRERGAPREGTERICRRLECAKPFKPARFHETTQLYCSKDCGDMDRENPSAAEAKEREFMAPLLERQERIRAEAEALAARSQASPYGAHFMLELLRRR